MKSPRFTPWKVILLLLVGAIVGSVLGDVVGKTFHLDFLTNSTTLKWHPSADFSIFKYDLVFQVKLNLASVVGLALGFYAAQKF